MYLAVPVKSRSVTVLAREVPFNIKIISFPYAGIDLLIPIGRVIVRKIFNLFNPNEFAASIKFLSIFSKPDLNISDV